VHTYIHTYIIFHLYILNKINVHIWKNKTEMHIPNSQDDSFHFSSNPTNYFFGDEVGVGKATMLPLSVRLN
jgi:hypothetical protein